MKKFAGILITVLFVLHFASISVSANEIYVVKQGDSLWKIATNNNLTTNDLKRFNNLETDLIKIGQKLVLKNTTNENINPVTKARTATPTITSDSHKTYVIQTGDNLWSIAKKHNTTVEAIKEINHLTSDALYAGQQLSISSVVKNVQENPSRGGIPFQGDRLIGVASQYLGTPYRYGGQSPAGFDCSGFTSYIFNQFSIKMNRTAAGQYSHGIAVSKANLAVGDLVFFGGGKGINHVGIYRGNGQFIHSSSPRNGGVINSSLSENYYAKSYVGARRILK
ncbi:MAG TPA: NlpC/P60 family protein [Syntrophomonadaceae bacterium]|nr:NlpC/P60 family protein [Syntrophomonadaceae bacterium]